MELYINNTNNSNNSTNSNNKRKFDLNFIYQNTLLNRNYKIYNFYKNDKTTCNITLCNNHIYFNSLINQKNISILKLNINMFINLKHLIDNNSTIYLHINSKGGYLESLLDFINFKSTIAIEIISIIENNVCDCGILLASSCNFRIINKNAKCTLNKYKNNYNNNNLPYYWGSFKQCENNLPEINNLKNTIYTLFCNTIDSKITIEKLEKYLNHPCIWDAKKYKKLGLADEIV